MAVPDQTTVVCARLVEVVAFKFVDEIFERHNSEIVAEIVRSVDNCPYIGYGFDRPQSS